VSGLQRDKSMKFSNRPWAKHDERMPQNSSTDRNFDIHLTSVNKGFLGPLKMDWMELESVT
jgi:hypothetical protein